MARAPRRSSAVLLALVGTLGLHATLAASVATAFNARGSAEQVYVTDAQPGATVTLSDGSGRTVASRPVNELGAALFRKVAPGTGYRVSVQGARSEPLTVLSTDPTPPSTSVYDQAVPSDGYGYLTTRDGTKLAYYVHPPKDVAGALPTGTLPALPNDVPTPVLIEYSGYGYANPAGPESGISLIANLMGFTVVDVNMRGTGCSGGAFDFFEPLQSLDGYDVIETIARQPWAAHGKVGMMGISYGGISQLFTAATRPPSLAAIAPVSLIDETATTLYPGGILNTGFAVAWAKDRVEAAKPAGPNAGQRWAYKRIQEGDAVCRANQALHAEAAPLEQMIRDNVHYRPEIADPLAPVTFVDRIDVPVFMACQWQDEQTGGHCPTLASRLTNAPRKWVTFTNGTHIDSLDPETFNRWYDFLMLYVARRAPATNNLLLRQAAPLVFQAAFGIEGVDLPPDPIQSEPTYDGALAAYEKLPPIRIMFDNGASPDHPPGHPFPGFERTYDQFPPSDTKARTWYFGDGGALTDRAQRRRAADRFRWDGSRRDKTNFTGNTGAGRNGLWTATPPFKWTPQPGGTAVSYVTDPLTEDTTVLGAGFVKAFLRATHRNVDLQATVTEVRPDGKETFVQSGWLRAKKRRLDPARSRPLAPALGLRATDVRPLPSDRFVGATIPLYYQGHAYRKGSRIRVTISAPGGDQPIWAFAEANPYKGATVTIARGGNRASRLTLPVVPGDVPTGLPACPSLRNQPCRPYAAHANRPGRVPRRR